MESTCTRRRLGHGGCHVCTCGYFRDRADCRSRRAVILIVAAVVSLAALYHLPYHLPRAFDETVVEPQHPDIERAVRVRVLQELIDTYYPME